jgi:UDP-sugar transporter A1/2/3
VQLLVSTFLLWKESNTPKPPRITTDWRSIGLYPIPSIIYLIHNNVQFATLTYVDTSTYQIMGNLKIVTTAILFRSAIEFQKAFANVVNPCCSHE